MMDGIDHVANEGRHKLETFDENLFSFGFDENDDIYDLFPLPDPFFAPKIENDSAPKNAVMEHPPQVFQCIVEKPKMAEPNQKKYLPLMNSRSTYHNAHPLKVTNKKKAAQSLIDISLSLLGATELDGESDIQFISICKNPSVILHPIKHCFVPKIFWKNDKEITFGHCLLSFFRRKNNANARFLFKLHNALLISEHYPDLVPVCGVRWMTQYIIRVDKMSFARLIGTKAVDNSLFHQQGNFPSHGFQEITAGEVPMMYPELNLEGIDFDNVRLLVHTERLFFRGCTEDQLCMCRWSKTHNPLTPMY